VASVSRAGPFSRALPCARSRTPAASVPAGRARRLAAMRSARATPPRRAPRRGPGPRESRAGRKISAERPPRTVRAFSAIAPAARPSALSTRRNRAERRARDDPVSATRASEGLGRAIESRARGLGARRRARTRRRMTQPSSCFVFPVCHEPDSRGRRPVSARRRQKKKRSLRASFARARLAPPPETRPHTPFADRRSVPSLSRALPPSASRILTPSKRRRRRWFRVHAAALRGLRGGPRVFGGEGVG